MNRLAICTLFLLVGLLAAGCSGGASAPDWLPPAGDRHADWQEWVAEKDELFRSDESPVPESKIPTFSGLDYFAYDSTLAVPVALEPVLRADTLRVPTTTGRVSYYVRYGRFTFQLGGRVQHLTAYRSIERTEGHGSVFVPFTDPTNRTNTYGGGRYLDLQSVGDGRYVLDFNYAYSPYCAYDIRYSCPIPPAENRLALAVQAGERYDAARWSETGL